MHFRQQMTCTMNRINLIIVSLMLFPHYISSREQKDYNGYKVLRLFPKTLDEVHFLHKIANDMSYVIPTKKIDFWKTASDVNSSVDVMVSPDFVNHMKAMLSGQHIASNIIVNNVGELVEEEKKSVDETSLLYRTYWTQNHSVFFTEYHSLSENHQFLDDLVSVNGDLCSTEIIGSSTENRPLKMIKISKQTKNLNTNTIEKPIIWIDAGIHAREWIAPITALFIANKLVRSQESSDDMKNLLNMYDFFILPNANPDGYEYSRTTDRMWRKTRSITPSFWGFFCRGVDPNRNYNFHWGSAGSSAYPCSETYHGTHAFSEPETRAISKYITKHKDRIKMYIAMHSYSQFILTPWGWTKDLPPAYNDLLRTAEIGAKALRLKHNTNYRVGSSTQLLYAASGGSDDWAHGECGIKYSYTFELRDMGRHGFILPKELIIPTAEETCDAITAMANAIAVEYQLNTATNNTVF